jgi:membrane protein CcdC involved in cytochrome C biogenesis
VHQSATMADIRMAGRIPSSTSMVHKALRELQEYAVVSAYLYVCLGALVLLKVAILNGQGVSYAPYGLAAIKALVLGKFILLGRAAAIGDRYRNRRGIYVIAHKSLAFLVLLLVLSVIEEVVVGYIHGHPVAASLALFLGGSFLQILAASMIMLLILIPYFAYVELEKALGEARLRQILFAPPARRQATMDPGGLADPE